MDINVQFTRALGGFDNLNNLFLAEGLGPGVHFRIFSQGCKFLIFCCINTLWLGARTRYNVNVRASSISL